MSQNAPSQRCLRRQITSAIALSKSANPIAPPPSSRIRRVFRASPAAWGGTDVAVGRANMPLAAGSPVALGPKTAGALVGEDAPGGATGASSWS